MSRQLSVLILLDFNLSNTCWPKPCGDELPAGGMGFVEPDCVVFCDGRGCSGCVGT